MPAPIPHFVLALLFSVPIAVGPSVAGASPQADGAVGRTEARSDSETTTKRAVSPFEPPQVIDGEGPKTETATTTSRPAQGGLPTPSPESGESNAQARPGTPTSAGPSDGLDRPPQAPPANDNASAPLNPPPYNRGVMVFLQSVVGMGSGVLGGLALGFGLAALTNDGGDYGGFVGGLVGVAIGVPLAAAPAMWAVGDAIGGTGDLGFTFLGAFLGWGVGLGLGGVTQQPGLLLGGAVGGLIGGGLLGYSLSEDDGVAVALSPSLSEDHTGLAIVGRF